jgi:hypothetical protein
MNLSRDKVGFLLRFWSDVQPPLCLKNPELSELATDPLSLLSYDAFILNAGKESS